MSLSITDSSLIRQAEALSELELGLTFVMLSDATLAYLSTLTYRAEAKAMTCWLPLSGVYWNDEIPQVSEFMSMMPEDDKLDVLRLFGIRVCLWRGLQLSDTQQLLWDETRRRVPSWAFFRRLTVSDELLLAQEAAEQNSANITAAFNEEADEVTCEEKDGILCYSATWNLKEPESKARSPSSWERICSWPWRPG